MQDALIAEMRDNLRHMRGGMDDIKDSVGELSLEVRTLSGKIEVLEERISNRVTQVEQSLNEVRRERDKDRSEWKEELRTARHEDQKTISELRVKTEAQQSQIDRWTGMVKIIGALGALVTGGFVTFCVWVIQKLLTT